MVEKRTYKLGIDRKMLEFSMKNACNWLIDTAQIKSALLSTEINSQEHQYKNWKGAIRGEYSAATKEWDFFCPVWHTGQAVKALVSAYKVLGDIRLIEAAEVSAGFIGNARLNKSGDEDYGLIFATEDSSIHVSTSAILECIDGLICIGEVTGNKIYDEWVTSAVEWLFKKAYIQGEGLFRDWFSIETMTYGVQERIGSSMKDNRGRPLLDDGIFLKAYYKTGNEAYKAAFYETADRLLRDEGPSGNWIKYGPCIKDVGSIHPRHAYWWGLPMIFAYYDSKNKKYLECAERAGEWYIRAQRSDGGIIRNTYTDFKTDSFGHATSGSACAAVLWIELYRATQDDKWLKPLEKSIEYCMNLQFTSPNDKNLKGAILEKVLPPDGTDRSPYHIRDLGTIFFVQAAGSILL